VSVLQFKEVGGYSPGQQLKVDEIFKVGDMVDVAGKSIGKGFQGDTPCPPAMHLLTSLLSFNFRNKITHRSLPFAVQGE